MEHEEHGKSYSTRSKTYKNFMEMLIRRNIPNPGFHASFFFDAFWLCNVGEINKDLVVGRGLCKSEGREFTKWRENLRDLKLLILQESPIPGSKHTKVIYKPGPLTTKYINLAILEQTDTLLATKADIQESEDKVIALQEAKHLELQKEIKEIKYMLDILADDYFTRFPPKSKQRKFRFFENVRKGVPYLEEDNIVY